MLELFNKLHPDLSIPDILDNIDAGIIIYDAAGNFIFMNTLMINWRNIPRKEYLQMNVRDFNNVLDICVFDLVCKYKKRITRLQNYRDLDLSRKVQSTNSKYFKLSSYNIC